MNVEKYALIEATRHNKTELAHMLLEIPGIDLNVTDWDGKTPLHFATKYDVSMVKKLLDMGADPNRLTSCGKSPFEEACRRGLAEVIEHFIKAGSPIINPRNRSGETALHQCFLYGHFDCI